MVFRPQRFDDRPAGSGQEVVARAMPGIMPALSIDEAAKMRCWRRPKVYRVCDLPPPEIPLIQVRPFRALHHTISHAGLVGGGRWLRPDEMSVPLRWRSPLRGSATRSPWHLSAPRQVDVLRNPSLALRTVRRALSIGGCSF
jgi:hypothetical protein